MLLCVDVDVDVDVVVVVVCLGEEDRGEGMNGGSDEVRSTEGASEEEEVTENGTDEPYIHLTFALFKAGVIDLIESRALQASQITRDKPARPGFGCDRVRMALTGSHHLPCSVLIHESPGINHDCPLHNLRSYCSREIV